MFPVELKHAALQQSEKYLLPSLYQIYFIDETQRFILTCVQYSYESIAKVTVTYNYISYVPPDLSGATRLNIFFPSGGGRDGGEAGN